MDKNESQKLTIEAIQKIRTTFNDAMNASTDAAIKSIQHFYLHGDGALILKCRDALKEYGAKGASRAFLYLVKNVCSITKDGGINDQPKHESLKATYQTVLDQVELNGLVEWCAIETGEADKPVKSEAEKAKDKADKAAKQAKKWLKEQAELDTPEGAKALVMLKYGEAFEKAYADNPSRAIDQFEAHVNKLKDSVTGGVSNRLHDIVAA